MESTPQPSLQAAPAHWLGLRTIRQKIVALVLAVILPLLAVSGMVLYQNTGMIAESQSLIQSQIPSVTTAMRLLNTASRTSGLVRSYVITQQPEYTQQWQQLHEQTIPQLLRALQQTSPTWDEEDQARFASISQDLAQMKQAQNEVVQIILQEKEDTSAQATDVQKLRTLEQVGKQMDQRAGLPLAEATEELNQFIDKQERILINQAVAGKEANIRQSFLVSGFFLFGLITAVVLSGWLLRKILFSIEQLRAHIQLLARGELPEKLVVTEDEIGQIVLHTNALIDNLRQASQFSVNIGQGKFDEGFQPLSEKDVLGNTLSQMQTQLRQVNQEEQKRRWTTEGIAQFSEILRLNQQDRAVVADQLIRFLVKYAQANQGSLFIRREEATPPQLELAACYAFDRKKYLHQTIQLGEGLAGQAWQEASTIHLTEVPDHYVRITSGLGDATPRSILIVPLKTENEVVGVVELASFRNFAVHEIAFVERVAESIASAIATLQINERSHRLLESSQQQAEQMRAQEEELRQNMEELQATQEEVARRQTESSALLQRFNLTAQATMEGLWDMVVPADLVFTDETPFWWADRFRQMVGYRDEQDFPNRLDSWSNLLHPDHKAATLAAFNAHLIDYSGQTPYDVEYQLKLKSGTYQWFRAVGKTLRDEQGKPLRVA
ncbi:MAG: PAS domain-containing protein, partial [Ferruginibacter sp.]|nr:PAS domain-containing protein [Cytophagales bacterium]